MTKTSAVQVDEMQRALRDLSRSLTEAAHDAVAAGLHDAEAAALAAIRAQTTRRTGDLEDKLVAVQISDTRGKLFDTSGHAEFIDKGTAPHLIRATRAGALAFQIGGRTMFRKVVHHPGTRARPFVAIAMAAGQMGIRDSLEASVNRIASHF